MTYHTFNSKPGNVYHCPVCGRLIWYKSRDENKVLQPGNQYASHTANINGGEMVFTGEDEPEDEWRLEPFAKFLQTLGGK